MGNMYRSTLLMIGMEGAGTGFHLDHASAVNIAWRVQVDQSKVQPNTQGALAQWVFLDPRAFALPDFNVWFKATYPHLASRAPNLLALPRDGEYNKPVLGPQEIESLRKAVGNDYVHIVYQTHGSVVVVPTGWAHQVVNLQPNAKLAFDYLESEELHTYAEAHRTLIAPLADGHNPRDYRVWGLEAYDKVNITLVSNMGATYRTLKNGA